MPANEVKPLVKRGRKKSGGSESIVSEAEMVVAEISSDGDGKVSKSESDWGQVPRKFRVKLVIKEYVGNAMTPETALYIRMETVRRQGLRFGEDYAIDNMLEQFKISKSEYEKLKRVAHFYFDGQINGKPQIVVPERQIKGCLKDVIEKTRQRKMQELLKDKIMRFTISPDNIPTGRSEDDAVMFSRPVRLPPSAGKDADAGRWDYTETPMLRNVSLNFTVYTSDFDYEEILELFERAREISAIGGARKVGKGYFSLKKFEEMTTVKRAAKEIKVAMA